MEKEKKKPGPVPGIKTVQTSLLLPPDLMEWGKRKPGGLSECVRALLRREYDREQAGVK